MPSFVKIIISFLIVVLISILCYLFFFSDLFAIKQFDFINAHLENKIQKELSDVSSEINNFLTLKDKNSIMPALQTFDFNKFLDKKNIREVDIADEITRAKNLAASDNDLDKIKLYDNRANLIFSTDEEEWLKRGQFLTFVSKDNIEKRDDFFDFKSGNKLSFIFDNKNNFVILKKNIEAAGKPIGLMLFYFRDVFLNDILRRNNFIDFKKPYFVRNIIILSKPENVPEEYLFSFSIEGDKIRSIIERDKSGNEKEQLYRLFYIELKQSDITVCRFVDNNIFILDKRKKAVLFFIFIITLYLLILAIFLFKKSEFEKAKEKSILFSVAILDEMLKARSREELETLHSNLKIKKDNVYNDLMADIKKISGEDKKVIEEQIELIFNKLEESFEKKLSGYSSNSNVEKLELLFEKFADTIAKKGININAPISFDAKEVRPAEISEAEEIEELDEIEEAEDVEELEEAEAEELQAVEDVGEATEALEETADLEELEEIQEDEGTEQSALIDESEEIEELEEVEEPEIIDDSETIGELEEEEEVPKIPEEFYNEKEKEDELAEKIKELSKEKTVLQLMLDDIFNNIQGHFLSLLINSTDKYSYYDIYQIGKKNYFKSLELNNESVIVQRIYSSHRIVYIKDPVKFADIFKNKDLIDAKLKDSDSFFIYPVSIFGRVKALVIISFKKDMDDELESIMDFFESNKKVLRKEVIKLN